MKPVSRCLFCVTMSLIASAPAAAAADEIGLSNDGVTWSSSLATPLFGPAFRWVPGDSEVASFYVRNQGPSSAFLKIEARSPDTDELLSNEDIALRVRTAGGGWVHLENGVSSESLASRSLGQGDAVKVDVNAVFEPDSTNQTQTKRLPLVFSVTLVDALDDAGGPLPETGARISVWLVLAAGVMLAVGSRLARGRQEVRHG